MYALGWLKEPEHASCELRVARRDAGCVDSDWPTNRKSPNPVHETPKTDSLDQERGGPASLDGLRSITNYWPGNLGAGQCTLLQRGEP